MDLLSTHEVFDFAAQIAQQIKDYLDEAWYNETEITLSINWSQKKELEAWASVAPTMDAPTRHSITLTYDLVEYIYGQAFDFATFARGRKGQAYPSGMHMIPEQFELLQSAEFMFSSGVSFVIFHELAHINQHHGAIRRRYSATDSDACMVSEEQDERITGNLACAYHATEFAADFEALDWMADSLLRTVKGMDYVDHAYLQCAIVSCIMLMFNGVNPVRLDPDPVGTHPYPAPRMDQWVKAYAERVRVLAKNLGIEPHNVDVSKRLFDASFWALMKWKVRNDLPDEAQYTDFVKGAMAHPNYKSYMRSVINLWTAEYRDARASRRFGGPLGVLFFTNEHRAMVGAAENLETQTTHLTQCLAAVKAKK